MEGQKVVEKSFLSPIGTTIQIDAVGCFEVHLETAEVDETSVVATFDGEYGNDLLVTVEEKGNTQIIGTSFRPSFEKHNDKLSAHKVISIALKVRIPNYRNVQVYGRSANVGISGIYETVNVRLNDGQCTMDCKTNTAEVITQSGDILVNPIDAQILALTKYGKIWGELPINGNTILKLSSTSGNIRIAKTE